MSLFLCFGQYVFQTITSEKEKCKAEWRIKMSVAVIVPAYNCQSTIKRCIESILKQTSKEVNEIIIVDDGSEDNTSEEYGDTERSF